MERVNGTGRFIKVRTCRVDFRILELAPGTARCKREYLACMSVPLNRDTRIETHAYDPESGVGIDLKKLEHDTILVWHEGQFLFGSMKGDRYVR